MYGMHFRQIQETKTIMHLTFYEDNYATNTKEVKFTSLHPIDESSPAVSESPKGACDSENQDTAP